MIGERCLLCDGPVSEGRCIVCGMPYKKDEILYHLNENSRDHYKHATEKARKIMRSKAAASGTAGRSLGKNASKEEIRAYQEKMRQEAVKRITDTKTPVSSGKDHAKKKNRKKVESAYGSGKKKTGKGKIILWIIVILLILLPSIVNFVEEKANQYFYEKMEGYGIGYDVETEGVSLYNVSEEEVSENR